MLVQTHGRCLYCSWLMKTIVCICLTSPHSSARVFSELRLVNNSNMTTSTPRCSMLFWSDWDSNKPRLEMCSMSGEGRRIIVDISNITGAGWPNGLTLDYVAERLYWIDARFVSFNFNLIFFYYILITLVANLM